MKSNKENIQIILVEDILNDKSSNKGNKKSLKKLGPMYEFYKDMKNKGCEDDRVYLGDQMYVNRFGFIVDEEGKNR
jgi:hypothetical protein